MKTEVFSPLTEGRRLLKMEMETTIVDSPKQWSSTNFFVISDTPTALKKATERIYPLVCYFVCYQVLGCWHYVETSFRTHVLSFLFKYLHYLYTIEHVFAPIFLKEIQKPMVRTAVVFREYKCMSSETGFGKRF